MSMSLSAVKASPKNLQKSMYITAFIATICENAWGALAKLCACQKTAASDPFS